MHGGEAPGIGRRVAAGLSLVLAGLLFVFALVLAIVNAPLLLVAWLGMAVGMFAISFGLSSMGVRRFVWQTVAVVGGLIVVVSLVWMALSSFFLFAAIIVVAIGIGVLGSFALHESAPTLGNLDATHPVLFVNPKSGGGKATEANIADIARARGIEVVMLERGDDLTELAREAIKDGADALGVAGGDGSLGYVAIAAIEAGIPFICIPAGTRNHFARDLGLDRADIVGALDAFGGELRSIDYATVNGRAYLNVASMGVYAETVSDPAYRDAKIATARETLRSIKQSEERFDLRFVDADGERHPSADIIMVSVGRYHVTGTLSDIGKRSRMDSGGLSVLVLDASEPAAAIEMATLSVAGAMNRYPGWFQWKTTSFEVDSDSPVPVGIDGETVSLEPPLRFVIHPGSLTIAVPHGTPYGPKVSPLSTRGGLGNLWSVVRGRRFD